MRSLVFFLESNPIRANEPIVVGETIDGESIIMHHRTGHYFSTTGSGAVIWAAVQGTTTLNATVARLVEVYEITPERARSAVVSFLEVLAAHDLIAPAAANSADSHRTRVSRVAWPSPQGRDVFVEPALDVHTELEDVLLLDPIHDVDEDGWPAPVAKAAPTTTP